MKTPFLVMLLIFIGVYFLGSYYIFLRGWQGLTGAGGWRWVFAGVFWSWAMLGMVTQMMHVRGATGVVFDALAGVGAMWFAVLLYGFLAVVLVDLGRLGLWAGGWQPEWLYGQTGKMILTGTVVFGIGGMMTFGYVRAHRPRVTHVSMKVAKQAGNLPGLRVAMVSDLHLGNITGQKFLARVVDGINAQQPDVVVLCGDTFDGGPAPVIRKDAGAELLRLHSTYGTFAATGNHEYIGRFERPDAVEQAMEYLSERGVTPLQDSVALVARSFYIAGRSDREEHRRKPVGELLSPLDGTLPVIVLDHQPYDFDKAEKAGADLVLAGHTHHGQMWPLGYVTRALFEQDWGYLRRGATQFYVSCGAGTWGPAVRTSGYCEIVIIDLTFIKQ